MIHIKDSFRSANKGRWNIEKLRIHLVSVILHYSKINFHIFLFCFEAPIKHKYCFNSEKVTPQITDHKRKSKSIIGEKKRFFFAWSWGPLFINIFSHISLSPVVKLAKCERNNWSTPICWVEDDFAELTYIYYLKQILY